MKDEDVENGDEVFRGDLDDCLRHLNTCIEAVFPKGSKGASKAKVPLAKFCGVGPETVKAWLELKSPPIGKPLIKLFCYLELIGYTVKETEVLNKSVRNFRELIGFDLLDVEEATQILGYSQSATLFVTLRGRGGALPDKLEKMWEIWKGHREQLDCVKQDARQKFALNLEGKPRPTSWTSSEPQSPYGATGGTTQQLAGIDVMNGLTKLLDGGIFTNASAEELTRMGAAGTIMALTARLMPLSTRLMNFRKE